MEKKWKTYLIPTSNLCIILNFLWGKQENPNDMPDLAPEVETQLIAKATSLFGKMPDVMPGTETDTPELIELGKNFIMKSFIGKRNTKL